MGFWKFGRRIIQSGTKPWGYINVLNGDIDWQPSDISNLALWLDADDAATITLDGSSNVEQWNDKSGNGYHVAQMDSACRPQLITDGLNSKDLLRFDGSDDFLEVGSSLSSTFDFSLFIVITPRTTSNTEHDSWFASCLLTSDSMTDTFQFDCSPTNFRFLGDWGDIVSSSAITTDPVIAFSSTDAGYYGMWFDGVEDVTGTGAITPEFKTIGIARNRGNSRWMNTDISEVVLYSRPLTTTEREKVEGYLAHKWGLAGNLLTSHPYKDSAP